MKSFLFTFDVKLKAETAEAAQIIANAISDTLESLEECESVCSAAGEFEETVLGTLTTQADYEGASVGTVVAFSKHAYGSGTWEKIAKGLWHPSSHYKDQPSLILSGTPRVVLIWGAK